MAASTWTAVWSRSLRELPPFTQGDVDKWTDEDVRVPRAKMQKGYSNFIEGYVHDVEVQTSDNTVFVRAYAYPSMRKNNPPYKLMVEISKSFPVQFKSTTCECKAGNGNCSHCIGLLYLLSHFKKLELKTVPPFQSKTSLPQAWHVPPRTEGLTPKPVDSLEISKIKVDHEKPKKRKRIVEGILPNIYCPVRQPIPSMEFSTSLIQNLKSINSDAQILKSIPGNIEINMADSRFGPVPFGSVLSYQQRPLSLEADIINHHQIKTFPDFPLPNQNNNFTTVLNQSQNDILLGLQIDLISALELENQTKQQSQAPLWHRVRKNRITSSSTFKDICCRRGDFDKLAERILNKKNIQTAAMKFGVEHEPVAAKLYADITGNNVYLSGFVINPSSVHLGTSPDRKVYDPTADPEFGLLEIKCPDKDSFQDCLYLKKNANDNTFKLKRNHQYYYQVIGQLALTGMQWCDFLVKCKVDYHKERIFMDEDKWHEMKISIDKFYFEYLLPEIAKLSSK